MPITRAQKKAERDPDILTIVDKFNDDDVFGINQMRGPLQNYVNNHSNLNIQNPFDDFLENILNEIIYKKGSLLTCKVRTIDNKHNNVYKFFDIIQRLHKLTGPFALGGIMLFNTNSYFKLGGFNPNDKFAEDYNLSKKVKSKDFILSKKIIYTSSRRIEKKGIYFMLRLMILSFLNRSNQSFFEKTHSYWS